MLPAEIGFRQFESAGPAYICMSTRQFYQQNSHKTKERSQNYNRNCWISESSYDDLCFQSFVQPKHVGCVTETGTKSCVQ